MPRTRHEVDRVEKVDELLDAAERRLLTGGYGAMSVASIARELGVAQNSVYWYFPSKDHLFVAVLRRILARTLSAKPPSGKGLRRQVLWFTDRLYDFSPLRVTIRERAGQSQLVADFERELYGALQQLVVHVFEARVPGDQSTLAARTFMATVEGTFIADLSKAERHRVVTFALERLAGGG